MRLRNYYITVLQADLVLSYLFVIYSLYLMRIQQFNDLFVFMCFTDKNVQYI